MSALALVAAPDAPRRHYWTTREEKVIRERFAEHGVAGCAPFLPGRSESAIYQHASNMGLKSAKHGDGPRQRWTTTPFIDDAIRRAYQSERMNLGVVTHLARTIGRPKWWVVKRARNLGLITPRFKELPWTEAELSLLRDNAQKGPETIRRLLQRHGFSRSCTAVVVKRKRLGFDTTDPDHYTAHALAGLFGTDSKTVTRWIEKGWLSAKRRGTARIETQGGDQWWIGRKAIRAFVIENVAAIDIRKVDKVWFVDLLAGSAA